MNAATTPTREPDASRGAKQLAAVVLDVLAGSRTPPQAAETLGVSLPRYYQLEAGALGGLVAAFVGIMLGGVVAAALLITGRRHFGEYLAFGPFLAAGGIVAAVWGRPLMEWYLG